MDREELINGIRAEQYKDLFCNVPIDVFPAAIRRIINAIILWLQSLECRIDADGNVAPRILNSSCSLQLKRSERRGRR